MTRTVTVAEIATCGVSSADSAQLAEKVNRAITHDSVTAWRKISREVLRPDHPFELHKLLFERAFSAWDHSRHPPAAWCPTDEEIRATNVGRMMAERGFSSVAELQAWTSSTGLGSDFEGSASAYSIWPMASKGRSGCAVHG
jgi:acetyl-CoA synthetase